MMDELFQQLFRAANALERMADAHDRQVGISNPFVPEDWGQATAWLWQASGLYLRPIQHTGAIPLDLLVGLDPQAETLLENTRAFAKGFAANNALLWGARGMGKSSLVKAIYNELDGDPALPLHLIEIYREDLPTLQRLLDVLRTQPDIRFLLFCDDLSFNENDSSYKSLKAVLEGGISGRPDNVIIYATSNRRHLLPREMIENERSTAIHKSESTEEKVSLSDRFGLWLGFYNCSQDQYLEMITRYADHYGLKIDEKDALEWSVTRGNRSGRVAWQFIQHSAGQQGKTL